MPGMQNAGSQWIFVHGAAGSSESWRALFEAWPTDAMAGGAPQALNLPDEMSVEAMAVKLAEQLGQNGLAADSQRPVHLVGYSLGALVALELAAMWSTSPGHGLSSLWLLGVACPMSVNASLLDLAKSSPADAVGTMAKYSYPSTWVDQHPHELALARQQMLDAVTKPGHEGQLWRQLQACDRYSSGPKSVAQLACPIHIVHGDKDKMTRPEQAQPLIDAARPAASVQTHAIQGHGHATPHTAVPELLNLFLGRAGPLGT